MLLDIDGTVADGLGGAALPGAVDAVRTLAAQVPLRYVTNATSRTRRSLTEALAGAGFPVGDGMVVTPTVLARRALQARDAARGIVLAEPTLADDLGWFEPTAPRDARTVLVATEGHHLQVRELWPALDALLAGAALCTLQQNRYFRRDGRLVTDLGPLAAYLGYAARTSWENFGKPAPALFAMLAADLGVAVSELAMVGDDAEFDAAGALAAGCGWGVLVRTGKYRAGDETRVAPTPSLVVDSVASLPAALGFAS